LHPQSWLVAAVYRDNKLIIPHGDTILRTGDEVVIVGEPEVLDTEMSFLQGGQILFPSQYGSQIGVVGLDKIQTMVNTVVANTEALKYSPISFETINPEIKSRAEIRQYLLEHEIGMIMLPPRPVSWVARWGFRTSKIMSLMFNAQIPFWVDNETKSIKKVMLCTNNPKSLNVLGTVALDLARQFDAELTSLNVFPPNISLEEREIIKQIPNELQHLAHTHGVEISKIEVTGNPISEIINQAADFELIVVGYSTHYRSTFNNPDISLHLFHQIRTLPNTSIVFIPWQTAGR
jgi:nucleotide-binding universal stress UspA family protein